jgi:hypothetical protein
LKLSAVPTVLRHLGLLPKSSNESLETEHQSTLRSAVAQRQSLNPLVIEPVHNDWAHLVSRGAEPWPPHIATKALFIWSSRQGVIDTRTSNQSGRSAHDITGGVNDGHEFSCSGSGAYKRKSQCMRQCFLITMLLRYLCETAGILWP